LHLYGQEQRTVSGKVTDDSGAPLIGVTVIIDGTTSGTVSDLDGNFSLEVQQGQTLVFRMVSMQSQSILVANQSNIEVRLKEDISMLNEVVINGFQEVDRKLFTGSAERVQMEYIQINANPDASRSLEGRVAGLSVDNVSGTFGTTPKIRIRGNVSINGNNQPLFVVDGVILEDLTNVNTDDFISGNANTLISSSIANLNPDDIESFQVLKDASATAIYGGRAANGVIVITTKRGRSGKLRIKNVTVSLKFLNHIRSS